MEKKPYEAPQVFELGAIQELTQEGGPHKCGGSGDEFLPETLQRGLSEDCPA